MKLLAGIERPEQQLDTLKEIFCATLGSSHLHIVNSSVSLWNKMFENAQELDYPEELKDALVLLQPHVDIVVPGLDIATSGEYAQRHPLFSADSVEELGLPKVSHPRRILRSSPRKASPVKTPETGSRYSTRATSKKRGIASSPAPSSATRSGRRNAATPRLRHDDSQIQFAPIAPSSPSKEDELESQVLTERQREVKERQQREAATGLLREMRSSPVKQKGSGRDTDSSVVGARDVLAADDDEDQPQLPQQTAITPEPPTRNDEEFDAYITSTPTPRRGAPKPLAIPERDLAEDPPSSPPEPRRNPLAAEIRSRSASQSLLEKWQFSSSPVSGSPNPARSEAILDPTDDDVDMCDVDELPVLNNHAANSSEAEDTPRKAPIATSTDGSFLGPSIFNSSRLEVPETPSPKGASAQQQQQQQSVVEQQQQQQQGQETPKSESEEYVDAPSTPLPASPKVQVQTVHAPFLPSSPPTPAAGNLNASQPQRQPTTDQNNIPNPSFDLNDADERSMLRLVIELDSNKTDKSQYRKPSASPDKLATGSPAPQQCIVVDGPAGFAMSSVATSPEKPLTRSTSKRLARAPSVNSSVVPSSQPQLQSQGLSLASGDGLLGGLLKQQKRKRASSRVAGGDSKKRKQDGAGAGGAGESDRVADSFPAPGASNEGKKHSR